MPSNDGSHATNEAFRILRTLYQLSTDLFSSQNKQELNFRILNSTVNLFPYNRAVLWSFDSNRQKLTGISGQGEVKPQSELALHWRDIVTSINEKKITNIRYKRCK